MTNKQKIEAIKELARTLDVKELEVVGDYIWDLVEDSPEFIADLTQAFNDQTIARVLEDPKNQ